VIFTSRLNSSKCASTTIDPAGRSFADGLDRLVDAECHAHHDVRGRAPRIGRRHRRTVHCAWASSAAGSSDSVTLALADAEQAVEQQGSDGPSTIDELTTGRARSGCPAKLDDLRRDAARDGEADDDGRAHSMREVMVCRPLDQHEAGREQQRRPMTGRGIRMSDPVNEGSGTPARSGCHRRRIRITRLLAAVATCIPMLAVDGVSPSVPATARQTRCPACWPRSRR
jgi:hypothetical protein